MAWNLTQKARIGQNATKEDFEIKVSGYYSLSATVEMDQTHNAGIRARVIARVKGTWTNLYGGDAGHYTADKGMKMTTDRMTVAKAWLNAGDIIAVQTQVNVSAPLKWTGGGDITLKWLGKT
ncbi:hypothetical protein [Streptomyces yunnanensis]|uniref:Uncharacterized protein n=1 Tax=Streptomyces yunnanensis TaxID=156453 RepID=A0A9X8QZM0_9ACTN|nr:hypothetical protein [Streptomyces yunnanensis]SHN24836.1 hypothetical protein SAMN05216268_126143 [Streptomyces yunnanensis]